MSGRSRWLLGTTLALVAGAVAVWTVLAPGGRVEVKLIFIGYTNTGNYLRVGSGSVMRTASIDVGMLLATNTGSVPVRIFPNIRYDTRTNTGEFALPLFRGSSVALRPGDSVFINALVLDPGQRWWTELSYSRNDMGLKIHEKLSNTQSPVAQWTSKHLFTGPDRHWAQSGWSTHPPPLVTVPELRWTDSAWTRPAVPVDRSVQWRTHKVERRLLNLTETFNTPDHIDASRPRRRYHITAPPPDWKDIDWQGINPSAPASRPLQ